MRILTDDEVRAVPAAVLIAAARETLLQAGRGELVAPPRSRIELGDRATYVLTAGALADGTSGFRVYEAGHVTDDQLVAVWGPDGHLTGLVLGNQLGARRTGALGAVAVDTLARPDADVLGLVGTGRQAWTQLWAVSAVRPLREVRVHSRDAGRRASFVARARDELGVPAVAVEDARAAVAGAGIVVLATVAPSPVIDAADVAPGAHVSTLGPNLVSGHETPLGLLDRAAVLVTDSVQQTRAFAGPYFTGDRPLVALGDVLVGAAQGRRSPEDITVFCSVGLAGSEVAIAQRLLGAD
ncbi:MAG: ornithine cyclodeaminase/mu-crystallin [Mycobacterium sp.]|nr:ornithine cyclodeaminase/mu-crystallin [Mycobacterium sp.]